MIEDSSKLNCGQILKVDIKALSDRLPQRSINTLIRNPCGELIGYKMVDGNQFGLVLKFEDNSVNWFFEHELIEPQSNDSN